MKLIACSSCRKQRKVNSGATYIRSCISCTLKNNKLMLSKCFDAIINQPDMKKFREEIEKWYAY